MLKIHKLTVDEMPEHTHNPNIAIKWGGDAGNYRSICTTNSPFWQFDSHNAVSRTGGSESHNNLQPYFVVNVYKRIS